ALLTLAGNPDPALWSYTLGYALGPLLVALAWAVPLGLLAGALRGPGASAGVVATVWLVALLVDAWPAGQAAPAPGARAGRGGPRAARPRRRLRAPALVARASSARLGGRRGGARRGHGRHPAAEPRHVPWRHGAVLRRRRRACRAELAAHHGRRLARRRRPRDAELPAARRAGDRVHAARDHVAVDAAVGRLAPHRPRPCRPWRRPEPLR